MDNWPNIPLPSACPSGIRDPLLEDEFQSGDDAARPQFAAPRCLPITLSWNWMHKTQLATLRTFQKVHRADLFLWEDPFTGEKWEARFAGEEPVKWSPIAKLPEYAQVTATIKPVNEVLLPADAPVTKRKPSYILSAEIGLSSEVVERPSEQTYRHEDGSLGVMPANTLVPTVKNGRKCFEVYEQNTNELLWSRDLSNPVWSAAHCIVDANGELQSSEADPWVRQQCSLNESAAYTFSIEARAGVDQVGQLHIIQESPWRVVTSSWLSITNEWEQFELLFSTATAGEYSIRFDAEQSGLQTSQWRNPQLEKGESASPRIPTIDSLKTRHAAKVKIGVEDWFNPNEGTFVVEFEKTGLEDGRVVCALGKNATGSLYISTGIEYVNFINGGISGVGKNIPNGTVCVAARYSPTSIAFSVNGDSFKTATNNISLTGWEQLYIGKASWGNWNYLNAAIYSLIYYPEAVTDEELQAFSEVRHA